MVIHDFFSEIGECILIIDQKGNLNLMRNLNYFERE